MENIYYYLLFDQKLFFENETIEELLRERANYYNSKGKFLDFWLLPSPKFVDDKNFSNNLKLTNYYKEKSISYINFKNRNFFIALVSTNKEFINWMELRIGYFEVYNQPLNKKDVNSNGIKGEIKSLNQDIFNFNEKLIYPDLVLNRYKENLSVIYENSK
jgi:hypothetical protein